MIIVAMIRVTLIITMTIPMKVTPLIIVVTMIMIIVTVKT